MTNRCYEGSLQVSLVDSLSSRACSPRKLRASICGPHLFPTRAFTQPFHGLRCHARTGIEEDTVGLPGLLAQAVPMVLPLQLPQAAQVFHPLT